MRNGWKSNIFTSRIHVNNFFWHVRMELAGSAERTSRLPWSLWWRTRTGHTQFPTGSIRYSLEAVSLSEAAAITIKKNLLKLRLFNHLCNTRKKLKVHCPVTVHNYKPARFDSLALDCTVTQTPLYFFRAKRNWRNYGHRN